MRWALLGVGKIALRSVIPSFAMSDLSELVAVGSRNVDRASCKVKKCGSWADKVSVISYEDCIDHDEIDAIYIALPNHLHGEWSMKALRAGKHVFCEKPLAMNLHEAQEMNRVANEQNLFLAEAFMYRHHPQWQRVRELLSNGDIGALRMIRSSFSYELSDLNNIRLKPECGGGALMDVGCYGIDVARFITNEEPVSSQNLYAMGECSGVDEIHAIQMKFPSGVLSQVFCATGAYRENKVELIGSRGKIEVPVAFVLPAGKQVNILVHNKQGQMVHKVQGDHCYRLEIECFEKSVLSGELIHPLESGMGNAQVLFSKGVSSFNG
jgi:predicted dehydrogenase